MLLSSMALETGQFLFEFGVVHAWCFFFLWGGGGGGDFCSVHFVFKLISVFTVVSNSVSMCSTFIH